MASRLRGADFCYHQRTGGQRKADSGKFVTPISVSQELTRARDINHARAPFDNNPLNKLAGSG